MATCRATISGALRKIGRLGAGREPRTADLTDALSSLQGLYRSWINGGAFGRLCDVVPTQDYVTRGNERILRRDGDVLEIKLPELVADHGAYCCTSVRWENDRWLTRTTQLFSGYVVRPPRDGMAVVISDEVSCITADFIYDGSVKKWVGLSDLCLDDEAPLSFRDPKGLEAVLAMLISDEYGAQVGPMTQRMAANYQTSLAARWSMPREEAMGVYF